MRYLGSDLNLACVNNDSKPQPIVTPVLAAIPCLIAIPLSRDVYSHCTVQSKQIAILTSVQKNGSGFRVSF